MYFYLPSFKPQAASLKINYLSVFKDKSIVYIFTYILLISLFYHGIQQWLGVYFSVKYEFNQLLISMLIILTSLSAILGEVFGGWSADTFGRIKIVNSGIVLMIISVLLLMFKMPFIALSFIMIIWGLGWTFNHAGISTILTDLPKEFLNEAASLNSSVRFVSGGLGAFLGGLLMQKNFNLGFLVFVICLLCLLFFTKQLIVKI
jgi:predicted MFS family arabinose efflux permease